VYRESGELLFADYGVTGVCVMQCARYVQPGDTLHIDLIRAMGFENPEEIRSELHRRRTEWSMRPGDELLTGLCVPKLAQALMQTVGVKPLRCGALTAAEIDRLVDTAADFMLIVRGVKGFDSAQVTAGGIAAGEFRADTMESMLATGVHAAGEVLDVDGDCGGFNLMFAFGSGILAGLNGRVCPWN
jgi:predicted Rossmann fold flavoprotein